MAKNRERQHSRLKDRQKLNEMLADFREELQEEGIGMETLEQYFTFDRSVGIFTLTQDNRRAQRHTTQEFKVVDVKRYVQLLNDDESDVELHWQVGGEGGDKFIVSFSEHTYEDPTGPPPEKIDLPAGIFTFAQHPQTRDIGFTPYTFSSDEYLNLSSHTKHIVEDINVFLSMGERYKALKLLHKRGILLYGPPGTGKTMLIEQVARELKGSCRVIFLGNYGIGALDHFKGKLGDIPTIVIAEEFTQNCHDQEVLDFLDGEGSWDKCMFIATTNYPEQIPGNLIDRPARFDSLYQVGMPSLETRRKYLEGKLDKSEVTEKVIKLTEGYSLAYLKELVVATKVYDRSVQDIAAEFKARKALIQKFAAKNEKDVGRAMRNLTRRRNNR